MKRALLVIPLIAGLFVVASSSAAYACGDRQPDPVYGCEAPPTTTEAPPTTTGAPPPTTTIPEPPPCGYERCSEPATPIIDCSVDLTGTPYQRRPECPPLENGWHGGPTELPHTGQQTDAELAIGALVLALAFVALSYARVARWTEQAR